jgi:diacylglycerol kinase family enzyme
MAEKRARGLLIMNPKATTASEGTLEVLVGALSSELELRHEHTRYRGHAADLAEQAAAEGVDVVIAFGGDGTVNEAVTGLMAHGSKPEDRPRLAIVPGGSTNVFARALGLPNHAIEATATLLRQLRVGTGDNAGRGGGSRADARSGSGSGIPGRHGTGAGTALRTGVPAESDGRRGGGSAAGGDYPFDSDPSPESATGTESANQINPDAETTSVTEVESDFDPNPWLGRTRLISLGAVRPDDESEERYFTFAAGFGFDAAVVGEVERRRAEGKKSTHTLYLRSAVREYVRRGGGDRHNAPITAKAADGSVLPELFMATVANTSPWTYLGQRPIIATPQAGFDSGLDLFGLTTLSVLPFWQTIGRLLTESPRLGDGSGAILRHDLPELTLLAHRPVPFQVDGDYLGPRERVTFRSVPAALRVFA